MLHPGPNHYDPAIDGSPYAAFKSGIPAAETPPSRERLYTREDVRGIVAGEVTIGPAFTGLPRRIWSDEPNVGFVESEMAFKFDCSLRVGGPTLKTYTLNNGSTLSRVRESLIFMDDTYRKLRASEDQLEQADMLNAVGAWATEKTAAVGVDLQIATSAGIFQSDARTYSDDADHTINLLRRGVYLISYRTYATPAVGALTVTLTVGSSAYAWSGLGLPTTLTVVDQVTYVKTDDSTTAITLTNTLGTLIGDGTLLTYVQIVKLKMSTFAECVADVTRRVNTVNSSVAWTQEDIKASVNEGYLDFCEQTRLFSREAEVGCVSKVPLMDARTALAYPFLGVRTVFSRALSLTLRPTTVKSCDDRYNRWEMSPQPVRRFFIRGLYVIGLWPPPSTDERFRMSWTSLPDEMTDDDAVPEIPEEFHDALVMYALYDLKAQEAEVDIALSYFKEYVDIVKLGQKYARDQIKTSRAFIQGVPEPSDPFVMLRGAR